MQQSAGGSTLAGSGGSGKYEAVPGRDPAEGEGKESV
jgi:hypothetical protein